MINPTTRRRLLHSRIYVDLFRTASAACQASEQLR